MDQRASFRLPPESTALKPPKGFCHFQGLLSPKKQSLQFPKVQ